MKPNQELDQGWIELMLEAKKEGIHLNEIREFLRNPHLLQTFPSTKTIGKTKEHVK